MHITTLLNSGKVNLSCELFPPKEFTGLTQVTDTVKAIAALKPAFMSVTYGAGGNTQSHTLEVSKAVESAGITPLFHLTCVNSDKQQVQDTLAILKANGIENVLALRGDIAKDTIPPEDFRHASDLIRAISESGDFCIGAACYPEGHIDCDSLDLDTVHLRRKQEAGADFLITQLFFDNDLFLRFLERARKGGVTLPISAGVMPILSQQQISRMIFLCGASLPSNIIRLLHKHEKSPDDLFRAGIEFAARQMEQLLAQGVDGIHIYTMNKPQIARYCMKHIGRM